MSALPAEVPPRPDTPRGVEPIPRRGDDGAWIYRFRTRWTDPLTGKRPPAEFDTVGEVLDFRAYVRASRARGELSKISRQAVTLDQFAELVFWPRYAHEFLAPKTIASYRSAYRRHLQPTLGDIDLRRLSAPAIEDHLHELLLAGVGRSSVRLTHAVLQAICSRAVVRGIIKVNPVREVRKPKPVRKPVFNAPGSAEIEAVRAQLGPTDAALVSLLGYIGLRPSEALGLEERHIGQRTLLVGQRATDGTITLGLKTSRDKERDSRSPKLYTAVREDLERHLAARGPADGRAGRRLVFPGENGRPWTSYQYRRWRETVLAPAVKRAGANHITRPYDLRHGCASMLLHAGRPLTEISAHMGHAVATLNAYYAHMILELADQDPVDVEDQIAAARLPLPTSEGDAMRQIP